jgi:predicted NBD/HSP70 family sugar kinase
LTGIVRSNISGIAEELLERRFLTEKRAKPSGPGRVPVNLYLNKKGFHAIAVSIRATTTTVAVAGLTGEFRDTVTFPTSQEPPETVDQIALVVQRMSKRLRLRPSPDSTQLAISLPGLVHSDSGLIRWLASLPGYSEFNIADAVQRRTGIPSVAENDCNLAALAELAFAEAETNHIRDFVLLEVGDIGVGGSIVINRALYRGHDSAVSAEFGHMVVDPSGPRCPCGRCGCWELFVSDRATLSRYCPDDEGPARSFDRFKAALPSGEAAALAAVEKTAQYLALGISNIAFMLNPEVIIVAGRITEVWSFFEPFVLGILDSAKIQVTVQVARHTAEELFLHGAVQLALRRVFAPPTVGW